MPDPNAPAYAPLTDELKRILDVPAQPYSPFDFEKCIDDQIRRERERAPVAPRP